jgi:hypothetical protein
LTCCFCARPWTASVVVPALVLWAAMSMTETSTPTSFAAWIQAAAGSSSSEPVASALPPVKLDDAYVTFQPSAFEPDYRDCCDTVSRRDAVCDLANTIA